MKKIINEIARYIVSEVQEKSIESGFQYTINGKDIIEKYRLRLDEAFSNAIEEALWDMEEVSDVIQDGDWFDVVIYTAYAPNYNEEDYNED